MKITKTTEYDTGTYRITVDESDKFGTLITVFDLDRQLVITDYKLEDIKHLIESIEDVLLFRSEQTS